MPFEITEQNAAALESLFKPWEEPLLHRTPNPVSGGQAIIQPGRRPSKVPLVRGIRAEVDSWRRGGYGGISDTSRTLLTFWFDTDHQINNDDGIQVQFRYHWAQREAIETIIYLFEVRNIRSVAELMFEFGGNQIQELALGIPPDQDRWAKNCCKVATGGGKTKVMSLAVIWSYFNSIYEPNSILPRHFVIIAPNLTVYERLKDDFEDCRVFYKDPLIPDEWKSDFQLQVVLQDESGGSSTQGAIYLTNIHRLYESRESNQSSNDSVRSIFGPEVNRGQALDTSIALRKRITVHPRLMVMNDEAHHLHDPDLAWNRAIDALHNENLSKGNHGICLQLDFTATPKFNDGTLFNHIICDFPLGEAVDAGIVKVPVIGESDQLVLRGDRHTPAHERYNIHLQLGYQRYEKTYQELNMVRKPILFVMTEDAQAANEIADYLDTDQFPLLKGHVLNIHTRLKGRIKTVIRGGREIKEFVENETAMKPDDLRELREMSRELDAKDSKFRCVVSVMMLREGWDVRNVTTIIPLRPYSAKSGILPEQTLGRGLRRMFPLGDTPEMVTVVHHPAFRKLYEEELAQEGLDIAFLPIEKVVKQTVTIFVDEQNKPVKELDIELPIISDSIETTSILSGLTNQEIQDYFDSHFRVLPVGKQSEGPIEYKERQLFTDEIVFRMQLDAGLLNKAWSASSYFAQMLGRACHLTNPHEALTPLIEQFISNVLFDKKVYLYSGEIDHRIRDLDVLEHIRATFTPLILKKIVHKTERKRSSQFQLLSNWRPFQATSTEKRPAVRGQRTIFNLVPCENDFEQEFTDFCDYATDIAAFAKNSGPQRLMIDYLRPDGNRALYIPDFFVRQTNGNYLLVEMKGREDPLVPLKARAAIEWCKSASRENVKWRYLYVPYFLFQQCAAATIEELTRACEPSIKDLLKEWETGQLEFGLFEATAKKEADELFLAVLKKAGIPEAPSEIAERMRQSITLLDYAIRAKMPDLGSAFQPLLLPFDDYSIRILESKLKPKIPASTANRAAYFNPYLDQLGYKKKGLLQKNQRFLEQNLVFGRSLQKLGTLLFCIDYASQGGWGVDGIWADVAIAFSGKDMAKLYIDLERVNAFRNTRVAHVETKLDDADEAWDAIIIWFRCLSKMDKLIR
jgi:type III restriction enzyme